MSITSDIEKSTDNVLETYYRLLLDGDENILKKLHIPRSDVFYVREKYFQDTGHRVSLDRMERAMFLEGMLHRKDVLDPDRKREWE